jgi:adenylate cyclase, class 2
MGIIYSPFTLALQASVKLNNQEIEVKFYLTDMAGFRSRVAKAGAGLVTARVHEVNLRFDTPSHDLAGQHRVLRLRKDDIYRLTYKGPAQAGQPVAVRQEIEFEVSDFQAAQDLLGALGYEVSVMYEKYRTTFHLMHAEVVLDELPYGDFVEIEAPDVATVEKLADLFELDWEARISESYLALFDRLKTNRALTVQNLTFAELNGMTFEPADLGIRAGDLPAH